MSRYSTIADGEELAIQTDGQTWVIAWHPPGSAPAGRVEGSSGVCVTGAGELVIISGDGIRWDLPGGRPEGNETWEQTLVREVREEACATVTAAHLLGFCRSRCVAGVETGVVLVRAFWRAEVTLDEWAPKFEITQRRVLSPPESLHWLWPVFESLYWRVLTEAGVL